MNRTLFRGVTAGVLSAALMTVGTVATTALADGASGPTHEASVSGATTLARELPAPSPIRPVAVPVRHRPQVASRQHVRRALTGSPRDIARALVARRGWSSAQFGCLDRLWIRESDWQVHAENASGAYGIPQALPGSKMAAAGADWRTNPITQIQWGLSYISASYGTPCAALEHSYRYNYY